MNKKILVTLGVTGLILANVGFSFATSSNVIEKSKSVDYSMSQEYYDSIDKTIEENGIKYDLTLHLRTPHYYSLVLTHLLI